MGVTQTTTYTCDQCGTKVDIEGGMIGGPAGWLQVTQVGATTGTWYDRWECVRDAAAGRVAA